jgi:hypothetical protein
MAAPSSRSPTAYPSTGAAIPGTRSGSASAWISTILPPGDDEPEHGERPPAHGDDHTGGAVDQRRVQDGAGERGQLGLPGHSLGPLDDPGGGGAPGPEVGPEHDLGMEHGHQALEVAPAGGAEEGPDHRPLAGQVGVGGRRLGALDPSPGPAGQLPGRRLRAADQRGDLLEGQVEQVVEHEGDPLGRGQGVEHDQQGQTDRVGQQRLLVRLERPLGADHGIGEAQAQGLLAPPGPGAQHVQADAGHHRCQPSAEVADLVRSGPAEAQPGVLDGVVGVAERAEHPVGHRPQAGPVLLEAVGKPLVVVHRSHTPAASCHIR